MLNLPRVGVGVIVEKEGYVLLLKRRKLHGTGTWSTPGGHLEYGETPEACAIREVKEETDVDITNITFLGVTNDVFKDLSKHYITLWMKGQYVEGAAKINASHEMSAVGWFSWEALPHPLFLSLQKLLDGNIYISQEEWTKKQQ